MSLNSPLSPSKEPVNGSSQETTATRVPPNVEEGTLLINGSTSTTSVVSVAANATLGGTGDIGGSVTVGASGILSPGASIESLAAGSLSMASGSTFAYEVANSGSSGADLLAVDTTVSLTGVNLSLDAAIARRSGWWRLEPQRQDHADQLPRRGRSPPASPATRTTPPTSSARTSGCSTTTTPSRAATTAPMPSPPAKTGSSP